MSKPPSSSPDRHTFQRDAFVARREEHANSVSDEFTVMLEQIRLQEKNKWADPERRVNNMEYDLVTTDWILAKTRASEGYAQNLYAAMCNNEFRCNEVWPLLSDQKWGCSWRSAGGIIADMRQQGDYIDWYCSGISSKNADYTSAETDQQWQSRTGYVPESAVTEEIRADLLKLGWLVVDDEDQTCV